MSQIRVSLGFAKAKDRDLHDFAGTVSASLYGKAAFPNPPVAKPALDAANSDFDTALSAQAQGGPAATADKNNKRLALIALLRKLARYVEDNSNNDLALLLSSGFEAVTSEHNPTPALVPAPKILGIKNTGTGQLTLRSSTVDNSHGLIVRYAAIGADGKPGPYTETDPFTDSRRIIINGLIPGTLYSFQIRATLAKSQVTDWSDAVQHMSL